MIRPVAADGRIETGGPFTPIARPRVVERIAAAAAQRIALILAPAGYGKSVALRQYLERVDEPVLRYDVHPDHNTLLAFARGFADAATEVAPDARRSLSNAFQKSRTSPTPGADLAMWFHAHVKPFTGIIAIDDLHFAEADPEISKFLVSLIERTKGRIKWIIASRSALDLPVGSWLAYGEMDLNIDEQDLRFTLDEARQAAKATRVGVRSEELEQILSMTEGWATALSFALRTSTRSVDLRNITASTREMVYRYLAEQVYRSLGAGERELLHLVAYLPAVDIEVLRAAGYPKAKAVVEALRDRVAFIYPDRPGVYRCHDLFGDFLRHEVELEGDDAVAQVRLAAARALESAGNTSAALRLYADAKSDADVLRVLEACGFALMEQAHADVVHASIDALSPHVRAENALVLGLRGVREWENGRFDRAESLLRRAIDAARDPDLAADLAIRLALVLINQGRDCIDLIEPLLQSDLSEFYRGSAIALLAPAYAYANRNAEAKTAIDQAEELCGRIESDELRTKMYQRIGSAAVLLQFPQERVYALLGRAQALAQETALFGMAANALSGMANVSLFYEEDASKCSWYAQQALSAAMKAGERFPMQTALLQMINVEVRRGNLERIEALQRQFASTATTDAVRMSYIMPVRAAMAAWGGDFEEAYRLQAMGDPGFFSFDRVFASSLLALYAIGCGKRDRALELVSKTIPDIDANEYPHLFGRRQAEIARALCACVEAFAGRLTSANRILQRKPAVDGASVEAMREAAVAIWRAVKKPVLRDDAMDALAHVRAVGWGGIGRILERALAGVQPAGAASVESPLTKAELHVLERLAEGHSPKDIAEELGRSIYTIQAHVQNVIKKLGCSGRQEALSVARKRGFIA